MTMTNTLLAPWPVHIHCPKCKTQHIDEGEWAKRPHKTHQCQKCGHEWRPFPFATVGIAPRPDRVAELEAENARLIEVLNSVELPLVMVNVLRSIIKWWNWQLFYREWNWQRKGGA